MKRTAATLMMVILFSKITGLIREQVFAYFLGTGMVIDAFNTASTIPFVIFGFVISSIVVGFIPTYQRIEINESKERAQIFVSNLINILLIASTLFMAIIFIAAPFLVSLLAPAYVGAKREIAIIFTRIMSFSIYALIISSVFIGYFQIKNKFVLAESPGMIMNFLYILTIFVAVWFNNVFIIPVGIMISEYLKYSLFPFELRRLGFKHKWVLDFSDKYFKEILILALPIIIGNAAFDISTISDQAFASKMLENGGVSSMRYASLILMLISGVFVVSITTSIYPQISKYAGENRHDLVKKSILEGNVSAFILILPSIIGVMILAEPIMRLLFQRGVFDENSTRITSGVLLYYIPALLGQTVQQIYNKGYYSLKNIKTPIIITFIQVVLNISLNYILSRLMGLNGLALATSVSSTVAGLLSIVIFNIQYGDNNLIGFIKTSIKILVCALLMGFVTYYTYGYFSRYHYLLGFSISIVLSIFVYAILIIFARIPEVRKLVNQIYRRFFRKNK